jgi:signal transduction histidine kinase
MLCEFIVAHREDIVARTRERVRSRPWPSVSSREIEFGVPLFLTQLSETLRLEATTTPFSADAIGSSATRHGAALLAAGFTVSQVVHDYGDICQAITEIAVERHAPITVEEFHTLNRCLDMAIAEAVTEHARLTAQRRSEAEIERLAQAAHELRDLLNSALLAFHALKRGTVAINGNTGAVLGRSLTGLWDLVDRTLSEVRLAAGKQRRERLNVTTFVDEIAATGLLHAEDRGITFTVAPGDSSLGVDGDPQLLTTAVMNLLHNAFKHTPAGGTVILRAHAQGERLMLDIHDTCGGIPESKSDLFQPFGERRGTDRSGLGLGLSIARQAVRAHGGDIHIRNVPGKGCIFTIELPLAADDVDIPQPTESVGVNLHAELSGEYPATSASAASQSSKP